MRYGKLLAASGVLVISLGLAAVGFGPAVRSRLEAKAARYGATVEVERVEPLWLGVRLSGVTVRFSEMPSLQARLREIQVDVDISGGTRAVMAQGGEVEVAGALDELRAQAKALTQRFPRGEGGGGGGAQLKANGIGVRWRHGEESAQASGVSLERSATGWAVGASSLELKRPHQSATLEGASLTLSRGAEGTKLQGWKARQLGVDLQIEESPRPAGGGEGKAPASSASALASSEPKKIEAPKKGEKKDEKKDEVRAQEPREEGKLQKQAALWKGKAHRLAQAVLLGLSEGASAEVERLKVTVHRGEEALHVGPGALTLKHSPKSLNVSLAPLQAAEGGAPLLLSAEIPADESQELALRVSGGPVTLAMLGVHEGDMGLLDVGKATVEAGGEVKLSGDAARVEMDLRGVIRSLSLSHPKLSTEPVKGLDLRFAWVGGGSLDGSRVQVDRGELDVGKVHGEVSGLFERQATGTTIRGKFAVPLASCQSAVEALPAGLAPKMAGVKMTGTFAVSGRVAFESRTPDQAQVEFNLINDCRVTQATPDIDVGKFRQPFRRKVYDAANKLVEVDSGPGTPGWVSLAGITPFMEAAVMTTEDGGFRRHRGFDLEAIRNSIRENLKAGRFVRGASTISMQTAKNLYLTRDKTVGRKLQEAFLTMYLEQALSKEQILELYLNSIEFGPMIYGIGPAAQHYFHTTAGELSLGQALYLSSILPNPKRQHFGPDGKVGAAFMGYLHRLMRGMAKRNLIREDDLAEGLEEWVVFGQPPTHKKDKLPPGLADDPGASDNPGLFLPFGAEGAEEVAQELGAGGGLDAGDDLGAVVEARVFKHGEAAADGAGLGVVGAVDQAGDAGVEQGAGAHEAGLEGADEGAALEAPLSQGDRGLAEGQDLGVGGGVAVELAAVVGRGEQGAVRAEDQGADGDVAARGREGGDLGGAEHPGGPGGDGGPARARTHLRPASSRVSVMRMAVPVVDEQSFRSEVLQSPLPVLIDFYADWCGPCKTTAPEVEAVARELEGKARVVKVNIDKSPAIAQSLRIQSVPTFMVFLKGRPVEAQAGALRRQQLKAMIEPFLPRSQGSVLVAELVKLLQEGQVVPVDVRETPVFNRAHLPGAVSMPEEEIEGRLAELHMLAGEPVLYCRSGDKSKALSERLAEQGMPVAFLEGGVLAWESEGLGLERPD